MIHDPYNIKGGKCFHDAGLQLSYLFSEPCNFISAKIIVHQAGKEFYGKKQIFRLNNFFGYVDELSLTPYERIIIVWWKINIVL